MICIEHSYSIVFRIVHVDFPMRELSFHYFARSTQNIDVPNSIELQMCALVHRLGDEGNEGCVIDVCEKLVKEFGLDCVWSRRQAFVLVAGRMLATRSMPLEMYCEYLLPQVIKLASDGVPNVRLAVAEVLTRYLVPNGGLCD
jgi:hypothetical protein